MAERDTFQTRATRVINVAFGGAHHVKSLKWHTDCLHPWCEFMLHGDIATWDHDGLTALVVACHDECVRGEVVPKMRYLGVHLSDRQETSAEYPLMRAHPKLEDHVAEIRHQIDGRELGRRMRPVARKDEAR
jgi:hypothetical protein